MIRSFSFKNFCSFKDPVFISFEVDEKAPKSSGYITSEIGSRVSKVEGVIGPNASGKTNLLKVLPFLKWIFTDSFVGAKDKAPIPVDSFAFQKKSKTPVELCVVFEIKSNIYTYNLELNKERILSEKLVCKNKTRLKFTDKTIFIRTWNFDKKAYDFDEKKYGFPKGTFDLLRTNSSLIASAILVKHKLSLEISEYWNNLFPNVGKNGFDESDINLMRSLVFYSDNKHFREKIEKILAKFDLGLGTLLVEKKEDDEDTFHLRAQFSHIVDGEKYYLPIEKESSGTKRLLILFKAILRALANGGIAVLDEVDSNLHPDIVMAIVNLFLQPATNPKNAQLFFCTHSHLVLSILDKQQIILTQKTKESCCTTAWRLDENKNVRPDENIYAKYISGSYGAIPNIDF